MAEKGEEPSDPWARTLRWPAFLTGPVALQLLQAVVCPGDQPPIDPIREQLVMSLTSYIGTERNILDETPQHCHTLKLPHPILTNAIWRSSGGWRGGLLATTLPILYRVEGGTVELERALDGLCKRASLAIQSVTPS